MAESTDPAPDGVYVLQSLDHFVDWKRRLRLQAMKDDVFEFLSAKPPDEPTLIRLDPDSKNQHEHVQSMRQRAEWRSKRAKAAGLVATNLGALARGLPAIEAILDKDEFTAQELLDELSKRCVTTNKLVEVSRHLSVLMRTSYTDGADISAYLSQHRTTRSHLKTLGVKIDDEIYAVLILLGLPDTADWEIVRAPLINNATETNKLEIDAAEKQILTRAQRVDAAAANNATTKPSKTPKQKPSKPKTSAKPQATQTKLWCDYHKDNTTHSTDTCNTLKGVSSRIAKNREEAGRGGGSGGTRQSSGRTSTAGKRSAHQTREDPAPTESEGEESDSDEGHVMISAAQWKRFQSQALFSEGYHATGTRPLVTLKILDTGASTSMCPNEEWFKPNTFVRFPEPKRVRFGDSTYTHAVGRGSIILHTAVSGSMSTLTIPNVLLVPAFRVTLIAISTLDGLGYHAKFGSGVGRILKGSTCIAQGTRKAGLYHLDAVPSFWPRKQVSKKNCTSSHPKVFPSNPDIAGDSRRRFMA